VEPDPRKLAAAGATGIGLVAALGLLNLADVLPDQLSLDEEYGLAALYSAALLAAAALLAFALSQRRPDERWAPLVIAALLGGLALDELLLVHERLDARTDIDWQVLYLPVGGVFVYAVWRLTGALGRSSREARLILAGVGAWALSQLLEAAAYSEVTPALIDFEGMTFEEIGEARGSLAYWLLAFPEELLEMGGSLLLAVGFALALRRRRAPH
jgi:hypothetical protein